MKPRRRNATRAYADSIALITLIALVAATDLWTPAPAAAQTGVWNGLVVASEVRCSPYDSDDYRYSPSVEDRIIDNLGGIYGPYTGR